MSVLLAPFTGPMCRSADVPDLCLRTACSAMVSASIRWKACCSRPAMVSSRNLARTHHAVTLRRRKARKSWCISVSIRLSLLARLYAEVEQGASVRAGQVLIEFDADHVRSMRRASFR